MASSKPRQARRKAKPPAVNVEADAKATVSASEAKQAPRPDFAAEVARLAELKPLEYAHISKNEAKRLGVPVKALNDDVKAHRKQTKAEAKIKAKAKPSPKTRRPRQARSRSATPSCATPSTPRP